MEIKDRILGFDFARGLAIIGMVFVNFMVVMTTGSDTFLYNLVDMLSGKAAALFVVLAGVGMSLMYKSAMESGDSEKRRKVKVRLLKRAAFLFVLGLSYADILHYYGVYIVIGVALLGASKRVLLSVSSLLVVGYSFLLLFFNYETGWDFTTLEYLDFFTVQGFFRNLFLNGFHPVIPWVAFLLVGIWVGRLDFHNLHTRRCIAIVTLDKFPRPVPQTIHNAPFYAATGSTGSGKALCFTKLGVPCVEVVDSNGAGDNYFAGFVKGTEKRLLDYKGLCSIHKRLSVS